MAQPRPPSAFGMTLALRLYIILLAIILPTLALYYIPNFQAIEALHDQEVGTLLQVFSLRLEDWASTHPSFRPLKDEERARITRELERIAGQLHGVEAVALFAASPNGLEHVAGYGAQAPTRPTTFDLDAAAEQKTKTFDLVRRGGQVLEGRAVPVFDGTRDNVRGVLHIEVIPDEIGLGRQLPRLRANLFIGAAAMLVIVGAGVSLFFFITVRRPIGDLITAMEQAADGNLNALVDARGGEFGWLAASYNQMMRKLKSSIDENRRLIDQVKGFNEELSRKVDAATVELAAKNAQLQTVNDKLFQIQKQLTTQEKLAALGQVATIIAHELGTPLNAISGHLQMLMQEDGIGAASERLKVIDGQVDRLTHIVRDVLRAMRVPPPRLGEVRFEPILRGVAELLSPMTQKRGISVDLRVDAGLPPVKADPEQLQQVFMNLFTNAIDAMEPGGRLSVAAERRPAEALPEELKASWSSPDPAGYLRIDVGDTGRGMDVEAAKHAFEPFFTTKGETGTGAGLGLGLAICRQIVKNHQGEILIASETGKGTTFSIYLPLST